jgi:hypothetical protein
MHSRAEVMVEARQRELHRARAASGQCFGFENFDLHSGLRQNDGSRKSVRPCSNDDDA